MVSGRVTSRLQISALAIAILTFAMVAVPRGAAAYGNEPIAGIYVTQNGSATMRVRNVKANLYRLESTEGWKGIGFFDGRVYQGVFRYAGRIPPELVGLAGLHAIQWSLRDTLSLYATYFEERDEITNQRWRRISQSPDSALAVDSLPPLPEERDSVFVDEFPEVIHKVSPIYPPGAKNMGMTGQVIVKALVLESGTVGDLYLLKSAPAFDQAAVDAIRQYKFKPARVGGRPVPVWVAIPIRFRLL